VARDAAHITILDDNFASIVNAIKWGRNVFDNIRKFLQFQLTVNLVALTLTFVMACIVDGDVSKELPLNAVMLLWVNLIMDSMGALALATERPTDALLDRPPHGKERLLSVSMVRMVVAQGVYQLIVLFLLSTDNSLSKDLVKMGIDNTDSDTEQLRQNTLTFNAFVFCQFWNEINCRKLKEKNIFERFFDSWWFTAVLIFTFLLQAFMVEVAGSFAGTNGLSISQWGICVGIGLGAIPTGFIARHIPVGWLEAKYDHGKDVGDEEEEDDEAPDGEDGAEMTGVHVEGK
jgi:magnesium-transporting ATPase (P-type)